jgi:hypothetical protein
METKFELSMTDENGVDIELTASYEIFDEEGKEYLVKTIARLIGYTQVGEHVVKTKELTQEDWED